MATKAKLTNVKTAIRALESVDLTDATEEDIRVFLGSMDWARAAVKAWKQRHGACCQPEGQYTCPDLEKPITPETMTLEVFANLVRGAAFGTMGGWYSDDEVFISHVWRTVQKFSSFQGMSFGAFKAELCDAFRTDLLRLSDAPSGVLACQIDVAESATICGGVTFHFIRMD